MLNAVVRNGLAYSSSVIALSLCIAAVGCGDDTVEASGTNTSGQGGAGSGTGGEQPTSTTTTGAGGSITDPSKIPAEPLAADPATDCPGMYATTAPADGQNNGYDVAGQSRAFYLRLPDASQTGPRPVFVSFNGTSENGKTFYDRAKLDDFVARGFIVIAPSSIGNGTIWPVWDAMHEMSDPDDANKDLAYFDSLLKCVAAHHPIDKNRIYIGGHSAGGIMTNYMLQRRSQLLAGGIAASGVFSLTTPSHPEPLDEMMVLVTWGGDNDEYSGGTTDVKVPEINFVEQASLASIFYDGEPQVGQANCHGDNFGHAWLDGINNWMIDLLLAHPKGVVAKGNVTLPETPAGSQVTCTAEPFKFESSVVVECPTTSTVPGCEVVCQMLGDCVVENGTVGGILAPQMKSLGFSGTDNQECGGCITHCEDNSSTAADEDVLDCISDAANAAQCGPGIDGALPATEAVNSCCENRSDSPFCMDLCGILVSNSAAKGFLPSCVDLVE